MSVKAVVFQHAYVKGKGKSKRLMGGLNSNAAELRRPKICGRIHSLALNLKPCGVLQLSHT